MGLKKGTTLKSAFDAYVIDEQIGSGGSGSVYRAKNSEGKAVAVKVLDASKTNTTRLKRFRNEIDFCTRNSHSNVLHVLDSGPFESGSSFYVMPLYPATLRAVMNAGIDVRSVLQLFSEILSGVEAAHLLCVWHRDLKPENILVTEEGHFVVADFGIAHFEEEELLTAVETKSSDRLANFLYAAPEQKTRGAKVSSASDIYALGLILNELFTKEVPLGKGHKTISEFAKEFGYLDPIVDRMLSQDPDRRPTAKELKQELIARGNEFVSLQKLNNLKSEVISETQVDDPYIREPIEIVGVDYQNGRLIFQLSAAPPPNWIAAFQNPRVGFSSVYGAGPESFGFSRNTATVGLQNPNQAVDLKRHADNYVDMANRQYKERIERDNDRRITQEREQLRARIKAEEERARILAQLNAT